jgi:hypothetical protein
MLNGLDPRIADDIERTLTEAESGSSYEATRVFTSCGVRENQ